jgi:quercetin 2,3-dioxygenase
LRQKRLVGPWCFLDRYGPVSFDAGKPMDVAPHPHIGIQTVSWLLEGEILHRDSLGFESTIRPGELNVMTSGIGIAHSEETPSRSSGRLSGVQLWIALPDSARNARPSFHHHDDLPRHESSGGFVTVMVGTIDGLTSPAIVHSAASGLDVAVHRGGSLTLPLQRAFEYAIFVNAGDACSEGTEMRPDILYYLSPGREELSLTSRDGARLLLLGGEPFRERILMWWNFVGRSHEEIVAAREAWMNGERFGDVRGYEGPRLAAPPLRARAKPNPAS